MCRLLVSISIVAVLLMSANALALVTLTANDGWGSSSFNAAGNWSDGLAPSAGKDYSTAGYLLRTPSSAGNYTFAGDSLTVGGGTGGGAFLTDGNVNNNSFINKTPSAPIITVDNLILDASYIRDGMGSSDTWTLTGNIAVTSNGGGFAAQCTFNVDSAISGSGPLYIADNGSGEAARIIYINSGLNTYSGNILLVNTHGNADYSRLTFSDDSMMNFVIGASGVNNSISGDGTATFEGDFNLDLTGASSNIGDSWTIASATSQIFGGTFTVAGFTDVGWDLWKKEVSGVTYVFSEATGTLTVVPEPATIALLGLGGLSLLRIRKRR